MNRKKILIVDDNRDLADGLADIVESEGHDVTTMYTGSGAVSAAKETVFDIIFLDMKLPDFNGIEAFRRIHIENSDTKVIIITGFRVEQLFAEVVDPGKVAIVRPPDVNKRVLVALKKMHQDGIVLVADNIPDCASRVAGYLNENGRKAMVAEDSVEAVEKAIKEDVDTIVLDMKLPIVCGLCVYLELKERNRLLPIIVIANHEIVEAVETDALRSMSVTGCLFKPFAPEEVMNFIAADD